MMSDLILIETMNRQCGRYLRSSVRFSLTLNGSVHSRQIPRTFNLIRTVHETPAIEESNAMI